MRILHHIRRAPGMTLILLTVPISALTGMTHQVWLILYIGAPVALIGLITLLVTIRRDNRREVHDVQDPSVLPQPAEP